MKKTYILERSNRKGKRYVLIKDNGDSIHFGSDVGKTFADGERTDNEKENWIARHSVNKNYHNKNSPIFYSKNLLWNKDTLEKSIRDIENKLNVKIINKTKV